jgi:hypothetical protein
VAVVSMSKQEFSRLDVLLRVQSGRSRSRPPPTGVSFLLCAPGDISSVTGPQLVNFQAISPVRAMSGLVAA